MRRLTRRMAQCLVLLLAACEPVPPPLPSPGGAQTGSATVIGELPKAGTWRTLAVSLQGVALVQAEIGGPGITSPLAGQAALDPDNHFAVPFAAVPYGENRPVTVTGYGADGRPIPGIVLQGWLTVTADGFRGATSAAATPVGAALRRLWQLAPINPLAAVIARQLSPDDLQAYLIKLNADTAQDYSLMDGDRIADALLQENHSRTAFDIGSNGVRLPASGSGMVIRPARVRGTLYGLQSDEALRSMTVDDPLSPGLVPLPTVNGTPFLFYPVAPGSRLLTAVYGSTDTASSNPVFTYRRRLLTVSETDASVDLQLPMARPRQVPPGGTLVLTGNGFGTEMGTATLGLGTASVAVTTGHWTNGEVSLNLPSPLPSGPQLLQVVGADWRWEVQPLSTLSGPPRVDSATVTVDGSVHTLHLSGSNFSAYGPDHVVSLMGSDNVAIPVPVTRSGAGLEGVIPPQVTGSLAVHLSIGGVPAANTPAVTITP